MDVTTDEEYNQNERNMASGDPEPQMEQITLTTDLSNIVMDFGVLPPPLTKVAEAYDINSAYDDWVPGDIKLGPSSKLIRERIRYAGLMSDVQRAFDEGFMNSLSAILEGYVLTFKDGSIVKFDNANILKPHYSQGTGEYKLLPGNAVRLGLTYAFNLLCAASHVRYFPDGSVQMIAQRNRAHVARIPLMTGSSYCWLHGVSPVEREKLLGDRSDPLGYFIINGQEKAFLFQEHMAKNRLFIIGAKGDNPAECRITFRTVKASIVTRLVLGSSNRRIKMPLASLGKKKEVRGEVDKDVRTKANTTGNGRRAKYRSLNPLSIFMMMGWMPEQIIAVISSFVPEAQRHRSLEQLSATIRHSDAIDSNGGPEAYIGTRLGMNVATEQDRYLVRMKFFEIFDSELFPTMPNFPIDEKRRLKLYNLARMMGKLLRHMAGLLEEDKRDHWDVKQVEHADQLMYMLMRSGWRKLLMDIQSDINDGKIRDFTGVMARIDGKQNKITQYFNQSFTREKWGADDNYAKENVIQDVKSDTDGNLVSRISKLRKLEVGVKRTGSVAIRMLYISAKPFICMAKTQDGGNVGLTKALAITTEMTTDTSPGPVLDLLLYGEGGQEPRARIDQPDGIRQTELSVNGLFMGWCAGKDTYDYIIHQKRHGIADMYSAVVLDKDNTLHFHTDGSRLVAPVLVVGKDGILEIDRPRPELNGGVYRGMPFAELLRAGVVEYVSPHEVNFVRMATTVDEIKFRQQSLETGRERIAKIDEQIGRIEQGEKIVQTIVSAKGTTSKPLTVAMLNERRTTIISRLGRIIKEGNFSYCELSPDAILGISSSFMPYAETNAGPRVTFTSNNVEHAISAGHLHQSERADGKSRIMAWPSERLTPTLMSQITGADKIGFGQTLMTAVMSDPFNIEDSGKINEAFLQRGGLRLHTSITKKITFESDGGYVQFRAKVEAPRADLRPKYSKINEEGLPYMHEYYSTGDVLVGKVQRSRDGKSPPKDVSYRLGVGEEGYVTNVIATYEGKSLVLRITLTMQRQPIEGGKYSLLYSQKLTIGTITPQVDMPFARDGSTPDIVINPHSIPGRQTIGPLREALASKAAALAGERMNATAFETFGSDYIVNILIRYGFDSGGMERLRSGITGEELECLILLAPEYFTDQPHKPEDKAQCRGGYGTIQQTSRQPLRGRKRLGAPRTGEMEERGIASHGATAYLLERFRDVSDPHPITYCYGCNRESELPTYCRRCETAAHLGKRTIPFSLKMVQRLLGALQLSLRCWMITSDSFRRSFLRRAGYLLDQEEEGEEEEGDVTSDQYDDNNNVDDDFEEEEEEPSY